MYVALRSSGDITALLSSVASAFGFLGFNRLRRPPKERITFNELAKEWSNWLALKDLYKWAVRLVVVGWE